MLYLPDEGAELAGLVWRARADAALGFQGEGSGTPAFAGAIGGGDSLRDAGGAGLSRGAGDSVHGDAAAAARAGGAFSVAPGSDLDRGDRCTNWVSESATTQQGLRLQGCVRLMPARKREQDKLADREANDQRPTLNAHRSTGGAPGESNAGAAGGVECRGALEGELSSSALSTATAVIALRAGSRATLCGLDSRWTALAGRTSECRRRLGRHGEEQEQHQHDRALLGGLWRERADGGICEHLAGAEAWLDRSTRRWSGELAAGDCRPLRQRPHVLRADPDDAARWPGCIGWSA